MSDTAEVRNMAVMAQMRLDKMNRPHDIRPFQAGDELLVCGVCGFSLDTDVRDGLVGWWHDEAEILRMEEMVKAHDEGGR